MPTTGAGSRLVDERSASGSGVVLDLAPQCTHALVLPDCIGAVKHHGAGQKPDQTATPMAWIAIKPRQVTAFSRTNLSCSPACR